jgi:hypothetical protein
MTSSQLRRRVESPGDAGHELNYNKIKHVRFDTFMLLTK